MTKKKAADAARTARSLLLKRLGSGAGVGGAGLALTSDKEILVAATAIVIGYLVDALAEYWLN